MRLKAGCSTCSTICQNKKNGSEFLMVPIHSNVSRAGCPQRYSKCASFGSLIRKIIPNLKYFAEIKQRDLVLDCSLDTIRNVMMSPGTTGNLNCAFFFITILIIIKKTDKHII